MEQLVRVRKVFPDGTAEVLLVRESACSGDCHKCSGCGAAQETLLLNANNPIGAQVGQIVVVESASGPVLKAAAMLYMLPLVLFIGLYLVGEHLWSRGPLLGGLGFVLGIFGAVAYDRLVMKKKKTEYTIVRYENKRG